MQKLVWKNSIGDEIDLTSGNYGITEWEGFSNTSLNIQSQQVPFQDGGVYLDALMEQRELSVTLAMNDGGNLETRYRLRRELIHILNPKLGEGYLIYTNDFISKRIKCVAQIPLFETHNSNDSGTPKASLAWTACEPYWEDLEEISINFSGQETIENNGDVKTQIQVVFSSGSKNPVIVNKTQNKTISIEKELDLTTVVNTGNGNKNILENDVDFTKIGGRYSVYKSCAYGQGKYIYVGNAIITQDLSNNNIFSYDNFESDESVDEVIYNNGAFIAVGSKGSTNGVVLKSTDGINWTKQIIENIAGLHSIAYGQGKYIAVSQFDGKCVVSTNGESWTIYTIDSGLPLLGISFGNGKFVTFSGAGYLMNIYYSSDGESWAAITDYATDNQVGACITFDGNRFIIINIKVDPSTPIYRYLSTDGMSWQRESISTELITNFESKLIYGNGIYICIRNQYINYSKDLDVWETVSLGNYYEVYGLMYATGQFYLCGNYGYIGTTKNGQNIEQKSGFRFDVYDVCYCKDINRFCFVGGSVVGVTENGFIYDMGTSNVSGLRSVTYSNKLHLFCAVGDRYIIISRNGLDWDIVGTYTQGVDLRSVVYSEDKGLFCVVGKNIILSSPNGTVWNSRNIQGYFYSVTYGNGKFVTVGGNNEVKYSTDCITWNNGSISGGQYSPSRIAYGNGKFIAISTSDCYGSEDGITFNKLSTMIGGTKIDISYIEEISEFIITGVNIVSLTTDGLFFKNYNIKGTVSYPDVNIRCSASNGEIIFILGEYIAISSYIKQNSLINYITNNSDMSLGLDVGNNILFYFDDNNKNVILKYRQKYIGV